MRQKHEIHEVTRALYAFLQTVLRGTTVSYEQLEQITGMGLRHGEKGWDYLTTARQQLCRDGIGTFAAVPGVGIRHLTDSEVAKRRTELRNKKTRTQVRLLKQEGATVDLRKISREELATLQGALVNAGTIEHFTSFHYREQQKRKIMNDMPPPPPPPGVSP